MHKFRLLLLISSLPAIIYLLAVQPSWLTTFLLLLAGGFALVEGSDFFIDGAAGLASHIGISEHAVGLTIVAFGTSLPEFAVSFVASIEGHGGISMGNVIGSNITNILLILGFSMLIMPLKPSKFAFKDGIYMLLASFAVLAMAIDGFLYFYDGIVFLAIYAIFIYLLYKRKNIEATCESDISLPFSIILLIFGGMAVGVGGKGVIEGAANLSKLAGIGESIIAASIVAFGTSLPEFMTSVVATIKEYHGIAVGNIIGSNIVNIGIVLGASSIASKIPFEFDKMAFFFILSALMAVAVMKTKSYGKFFGILFLLTYFIFILLLYL